MKQSTLIMLISLLIFILPGCHVMYSTTLYPDNSGKIVYIISVKKEMAQTITSLNIGPFKDIRNPTLSDVEENCQGIVAWDGPKLGEDNKWISYTMAGYFEDISKVKIYKKDEKTGKRNLEVSFQLQKMNDKQVLLFERSKAEDKAEKDTGKKPQDTTKGDEETGELMTEMMMPVIREFKLTISVTIPGNISDASGWNYIEGRTAKMVFDGKDIKKGEDLAKKREDLLAEGQKIVWAENNMSDAETEAFKKELSNAKEQWKTLKGTWKRR